MRPLRRVGLAIVAAALIGIGSARVSSAQESVIVVLETNMPDATLFADSVQLGVAARGVFLVPSATTRLRLVPPGLDNWSILPLTENLDAAAGDTLALRMDFPYHYRVESVPFGASVTYDGLDGRLVLGETPLLYRSERPLEGSLLVERPGYLSEQVKPGSEIWNRYVLTLRPVGPETNGGSELAWRPPRKRRRWIDVALGAVTVGAGALAVHYKFKADARDDQYRETGDPTLRKRVEFYDTRAAVSLGVMQAGAGVLALRLALR